MTDERPVEAEAVEEMTPSGADLVIADPSDELQVFTALDAHDEAAILEELRKTPSKYLAYDYPQGGERVVDLSYQGVSEAIRLMNGMIGPVPPGKCKIAIDPTTLLIESVVEDLGFGPEPCWQATVYAKDDVTGYGQFGTTTQRKWKHLKPGTAAKYRKENKTVDEQDRAPDPFSRQIALGKAQRNAFKLFIPERIRQGLIAEARGDAALLKQLVAGAGAERLAELPPPLTDERALEQKSQARAIYAALKKANPKKYPPAWFHAQLTRAEHSHDRLDDLIAFLNDYLAQERGESGGDA